jgi:HEAT repeat protein
MPLTTEQAVSTFDQLLAALQHPNPNVRAGAAIVLGKTKSARAVEPLTDLLEDPVYLVYTGAAKALGMIGSLAVGSLLAVIQEPPPSIPLPGHMKPCALCATHKLQVY